MTKAIEVLEAVEAAICEDKEEISYWIGSNLKDLFVRDRTLEVVLHDNIEFGKELFEEVLLEEGFDFVYEDKNLPEGGIPYWTISIPAK